MEETDLSKCNATESSLWEIKSLQSHALPEIAYMAKFIDRDLPKAEWDLNLALELTLEDVRIIIYVLVYFLNSELIVLHAIMFRCWRRNSNEKFPKKTYHLISKGLQSLCV